MDINMTCRKRLALVATTAVVSTLAIAPQANAAPTWQTPTCATVQSNGNFTLSVDGLNTLKPTTTPRPAPGYANIVATTTANKLIGATDNGYTVSTDAGCTWRDLANASQAGLDRLTAGANGLVWGSFVHRNTLRRITTAGVTEVSGPIADQGIVAVYADPVFQSRLRVVVEDGSIYESVTGGSSWRRIGAGPGGTIYDADFAPGNVKNVIIGTDNGAYVSHDGGVTFTAASGDDGTNAFTVRFSPFDANMVWVESYDQTRENQGPGARIVSFSANGGNEFYYAFDGTQLLLTNGLPMTPDPTEPYAVLVGFGTDYEGYGSDISRYDVRDRSLVTHHFDFTGVGGMAYNPSNPKVIYVAAFTQPLH